MGAHVRCIHHHPICLCSQGDRRRHEFDRRSPYASSLHSKLHGNTVPVGGFFGNRFGLFDIHGNVIESCVCYLPRRFLPSAEGNRAQPSMLERL